MRKWCLAAACLWIAAACAGSGSVRPVRYPAGEVIIVQERPDGERVYLGNMICRKCHTEIYDFWRRTNHALSFQNLSSTGERQDPACLLCHTTGYGERSGFLDPEGTPGLAAVGCEACHGPGDSHAESRYPRLVPTDTGRDCPPCAMIRLCRTCHTPLQSPDFQLGRELALISCRAGTPRTGRLKPQRPQKPPP